MASVRYTINVDDNRALMESRKNVDCIVVTNCLTFRFSAHRTVLAAFPYFAEQLTTMAKKGIKRKDLRYDLTLFWPNGHH